MATPLDIGLLQNVAIIFPFMLVLIVTYALMSVTKIFGDNKGTYAFIAFIMAVLTLFSPIAIKSIALMAPWFVLFFIFSMFLLIAFMIFGVDQKQILKIITSENHGDTFFYWVIAIVLLIGIGSISAVVSQQNGFTKLTDTGVEKTPTQIQDEKVSFFNTLVHPKILGAALLLLIALFTVRNLSTRD